MGNQKSVANFNYKLNCKVQLNMAHEQGLRVFRQASDDAREMAMRVSLIQILS